MAEFPYLGTFPDVERRLKNPPLDSIHESALFSPEFLRVPPVGTIFRIEYFRKPDELETEDQPVDVSIDTDYLTWRAAGDLHWINKEQGAAQAAWAKADEIIGSAITANESRGEVPHTFSPLFTYNELEDWC